MAKINASALDWSDCFMIFFVLILAWLSAEQEGWLCAIGITACIIISGLYLKIRKQVE
jgi:hypothetical protein